MRASTLLVAALLSVACHDWLVVPPLNDPTPADIGKNPLTGLQLTATGILFQDRASYAGYISDVGIFGRESYNYFSTDGRTHSHYVAQNPLDPAGFTTNGVFNTPATFVQFNRAIYARVQVWRAALGNPACGPPPGATCYAAALTGLSEAGVDTTASLNRGVYHLYSTESGDALNGLNQTVSPDLYAHPSIQPDAPLDTAGQSDARYRLKIRNLTQPACAVGGSAAGICTPLGFQIYPSNTSPAPIFRNEELILLQAEALYFTGNAAGALADINFIRRRSGGLAARAPFVDAN